jgi:hypothetical protein
MVVDTGLADARNQNTGKVLVSNTTLWCTIEKSYPTSDGQLFGIS